MPPAGRSREIASAAPQHAIRSGVALAEWMADMSDEDAANFAEEIERQNTEADQAAFAFWLDGCPVREGTISGPDAILLIRQRFAPLWSRFDYWEIDNDKLADYKHDSDDDFLLYAIKLACDDIAEIQFFFSIDNEPVLNVRRAIIDYEHHKLPEKFAEEIWYERENIRIGFDKLRVALKRMEFNVPNIQASAVAPSLATIITESIHDIQKQEQTAKERSQRYQLSDDTPVTLSMLAPMMGKAKRTLEGYVKDGKIPPPDIKGGKGKANYWYYEKLLNNIRPLSLKQLPDEHPSKHF